MKSQRVIAFYPELVDIIGSIHAAIYYQQLYYWSDKGSRDDGFVYKSRKEIEVETKLTRFQQESIAKNLVKLGWLSVEKFKVNGAPTLHYKCLMDLELICKKVTNGFVRNSQMEMQETYKSSIHKITTEITSDIDTTASLSVSKNLNTVIMPDGKSYTRDEIFEFLWKKYPKKAGKLMARKAFQKVKLSDYLMIADKVEKHKRSEGWTKDAGKYVPHLSTWLNQERWDDEVIANAGRSEIIL